MTMRVTEEDKQLAERVMKMAAPLTDAGGRVIDPKVDAEVARLEAQLKASIDAGGRDGERQDSRQKNTPDEVDEHLLVNEAQGRTWKAQRRDIKPLTPEQVSKIGVGEPKFILAEDEDGIIRSVKAPTTSPAPELQAASNGRPQTANEAPREVAPVQAPITKGKSKIPVRKGRIRSPRRIVLFGPPGAGKTSLAADSEAPIILDIDDGSKMFPDLPRYLFRPDDEIRGHVPRNLNEIHSALKALCTEEHDYKHVVIDTIDRLEVLVIKHCLARDSEGRDKPLTGLEGYGFNKGPQIVLDEFRAIFHMFDMLIKRGMSVVILAHSIVRKFANPRGDDFDRYVMKCSDKLAGYTYEWTDEMGFLHYEEGAAKLDPKNPMKKSKGWSTGKRILEFDRTASWDAKARLPLPPSVEVGIGYPWQPFRDAIDQAFAAGPDELIRMIYDQCVRIGDEETTKKVQAACAAELAKKDGGVQRLSAFLSELRRREAVAKDDPIAATNTDEES